ncbi:hypothetical protein AVEN_223699-1 [Araneus ventricosus]|uniref:Tc1-like transposase DDE domain-containing protein n=1 Tax=Araneus ventricosus TaxID=182803 RepID=A0A4Y2KF61_ARAVE|nr:hypothetical protein AVEN_223699-1 [Araneus ventricosus]
MLYYHPHGNGVFQKDNCTSHRSLLDIAWLDEHSSDFSVMNWPLRSPDLNPIKHIWNVLEKDVKAHHTTPATLTELWTSLANIWCRTRTSISNISSNACSVGGEVAYASYLRYPHRKMSNRGQFCPKGNTFSFRPRFTTSQLRFSSRYILTSRFEATRGLFWDGPRKLEPRSDDEDDT